MNTVQFNELEIQVATSWNELTLEQQLNCLTILQTETGYLLRPEELKPFKQIKLLQTLLGMSDTFLNNWMADCQRVHGEEEGAEVFTDELQELSSITDFLFERIEPEKEGAPQLYQTQLGLTRCPYPYFEMVRHKKKKNKRGKRKITRYYAPADGLDNLSIYELGICFSVFEQFVQTQKEDLVHELLAVLYRKSKPKTAANTASAYEGDRRLPYLKHEATVARRQPLMASLPRLTKQLLLFWFASCRQKIIEDYPGIFKAGASGSGGSDWGALLLNLAGGLVHLDQVSQQHFGSVFVYLGHLEEERVRRRLKG